ncbi:unnamed protein product [marine sediment metagenome]|uniref:Holin n=1 Tax=marine sediment metagenome TaxID=412755 RepID=X1S1A8_9ZZZZ
MEKWNRFVIIVGIVGVAWMVTMAIVIRSVRSIEIDSQAMLAIWNPIVALLGGLVGYVAGKKDNDIQ